MEIKMQRREKTKLIEEILGKYLKKQGYIYNGYTYSVKGWRYTKTKDNVNCMITIDEYGNAIRLWLSTDAYMQGLITDKEIVSEENYNANIFGFWDYTNKEDFKKILEIYKDALDNKGLALLEQISHHYTSIRPTADMHKYLYENHEYLNKTYRSLFDLPVKEFDENFIGDFLNNKLEKMNNLGSEEIISNLLGLAAIYGDTLVQNLKGEWIWETKQQMCWIEVPHSGDFPIITIFNAWTYKTMGYMENYIKKNMEEIFSYSRLCTGNTCN